jgi:hypothetical protein
MSRDAMRGFKAKVEEEKRMKQVKDYARSIYDAAVYQAQRTTDSVYKCMTPMTQSVTRPVTYSPSEFHTKNMPDILQELKEMFPGCLVKHARLVKAQDGKMYDMDSIDEKVLPFIDQSQSQEYITVDWS